MEERKSVRRCRGKNREVGLSMQMRRGERRDAGSEGAWGKSIRDKGKDAEEQITLRGRKLFASEAKFFARCVHGKTWDLTFLDFCFLDFFDFFFRVELSYVLFLSSESSNLVRSEQTNKSNVLGRKCLSTRLLFM